MSDPSSPSSLSRCPVCSENRSVRMSDPSQAIRSLRSVYLNFSPLPFPKYYVVNSSANSRMLICSSRFIPSRWSWFFLILSRVKLHPCAPSPHLTAAITSSHRCHHLTLPPPSPHLTAAITSSYHRHHLTSPPPSTHLN